MLLPLHQALQPALATLWRLTTLNLSCCCLGDCSMPGLAALPQAHAAKAVEASWVRGDGVPMKCARVQQGHGVGVGELQQWRCCISKQHTGTLTSQCKLCIQTNSPLAILQKGSCR
jgi:hypothetical protein